jgi:hypothetical protein
MTDQHPPPSLSPSARGPVLTAGRDALIHALGPDRVLRCTLDGRGVEAEAAVMTHLWDLGFPVPRVHRVGRGELEMDRVDGPTMLQDLLRRPWRLIRHARLLAGLMHRLHAVPAMDGLPVGPVPGDRVVHLDLHPGNVILGRAGPVVIDWTHAAAGAAASDVALTWSSLGCFDQRRAGRAGRARRPLTPRLPRGVPGLGGKGRRGTAAARDDRLSARPPDARRQRPGCRTPRPARPGTAASPAPDGEPAGAGWGRRGDDRGGGGTGGVGTGRGSVPGST